MREVIKISLVILVNEPDWLKKEVCEEFYENLLNTITVFCVISRAAHKWYG